MCVCLCVCVRKGLQRLGIGGGGTYKMWERVRTSEVGKLENGG